MESIKVKTNIENKYEIVEYTSFGTINNNEIQYNEDGTDVTINIFEKNVTMIREKEDLLITFDFILNEITSGKYYVYNPKIEMDLEIKTTHLEKNENNIRIVYDLKMNGQEMGIYKFYLEFEVLE